VSKIIARKTYPLHIRQFISNLSNRRDHTKHVVGTGVGDWNGTGVGGGVGVSLPLIEASKDLGAFTGTSKGMCSACSMPILVY
jgi:hypothetical protein